jgi:hypothetical protein
MTEYEAMKEKLIEMEEVRVWDDGPNKGRLYWVSSGTLIGDPPITTTTGKTLSIDDATGAVAKWFDILEENKKFPPTRADVTHSALLNHYPAKIHFLNLHLKHSLTRGMNWVREKRKLQKCQLNTTRMIL